MMKKTQKENKKKKDISNFFIIGGVLIISASIILIKRSTEVAAVIPVETVTQGETEDVTLAVIPTESLREEIPEERLDRLISEKEPVFAFFHSNNCQLCLEMIDIVNEVYPEYLDEVSLVDINVYDEINRNLLIRANIQAIPTQYFFYRSGEVNRSIGLMSAEQLRSELDKMSGDS